MDYHGQKLSERVYWILTIVLGTVFWVVGYVMGNFNVTVYGWFCSLVLALLLCIPDWPIYNSQPVEWLKEIKSTKSNKKTKAR